MRRTSLPAASKTLDSNKSQSFLSKNKALPNEVSTTCKMGKWDYYRPKLSRKPFLKENLPSYKASEYGLFGDESPKDKLKMSYQRKVAKGIDLSDVLQETYVPEK